MKKGNEKAQKQRKTLASRTRFTFPDLAAREVHLVGEFNNWNQSANPMKRGKDGKWRISLSLKPGRYEYRFLVDGNWENDPSCFNCVPNEFGSMNCVRVVD